MWSGSQRSRQACHLAALKVGGGRVFLDMQEAAGGHLLTVFLSCWDTVHLTGTSLLACVICSVKVCRLRLCVWVSPQLGRFAGVCLPKQACNHFGMQAVCRFFLAHDFFSWRSLQWLCIACHSVTRTALCPSDLSLLCLALFGACLLGGGGEQLREHAKVCHGADWSVLEYQSIMCGFGPAV